MTESNCSRCAGESETTSCYFRNLLGRATPRVNFSEPQMQKIALLYDASQAVLSTFELDEVLQQILVIAREYFHLQNVAILLLEKDTQQLVVRSQIGWDEGLDAVSLNVGEGITGAAAVDKRPIYAPDVTADSRYINCARTTRSEVAIPLMVRDEVVGVLDCQSDNLDHFNK